MARSPRDAAPSGEKEKTWTAISVALIGMIGSVIVAYLAAGSAGKEAGKNAVEHRLANLQGIDIRNGLVEAFAPDDGCNNWALSTGRKGQKDSVAKVVFDKPFTGQPEIFTSYSLLDAQNSANLRIMTYASNITTTGFIMHTKTWGDSAICGVQVQWIAFQK